MLGVYNNSSFIIPILCRTLPTVQRKFKIREVSISVSTPAFRKLSVFMLKVVIYCWYSDALILYKPISPNTRIYCKAYIYIINETRRDVWSHNAPAKWTYIVYNTTKMLTIEYTGDKLITSKLVLRKWTTTILITKIRFPPYVCSKELNRVWNVCRIRFLISTCVKFQSSDFFNYPDL